jgi:hypothetical protein
VSAGIAHGLARPEPLDDLDPLDEAAEPPHRVLAHGLILDVAVTEPDAEDEAPAADDVERGDLFGDLDGMVEGGRTRAERHRPASAATLARTESAGSR